MEYAKESMRGKRAAINKEARNNKMNYGKYVGLHECYRESVEDSLNIKKETGNYSHKPYSQVMELREQSVKYMDALEKEVLSKTEFSDPFCKILVHKICMHIRRKNRDILLNKKNTRMLLKEFIESIPSEFKKYDVEAVTEALNSIDAINS